jgi:hypothetical protein
MISIRRVIITELSRESVSRLKITLLDTPFIDITEIKPTPLDTPFSSFHRLIVTAL